MPIQAIDDFFAWNHLWSKQSTCTVLPKGNKSSEYKNSPNNNVGGKISGKTNKSGLPKVLKPRNYVSKKWVLEGKTFWKQ